MRRLMRLWMQIMDNTRCSSFLHMLLPLVPWPASHRPSLLALLTVSTRRCGRSGGSMSGSPSLGSWRTFWSHVACVGSTSTCHWPWPGTALVLASSSWPLRPPGSSLSRSTHTSKSRTAWRWSFLALWLADGVLPNRPPQANADLGVGT